jgi:hypothetical protein
MATSYPLQQSFVSLIEVLRGKSHTLLQFHAAKLNVLMRALQASVTRVHRDLMQLEFAAS